MALGRTEVCGTLAFRLLPETREVSPRAGERVKAMQCSSSGPASASSLPVKAARALSARSLESQTSCQAACSTSGLHLPLHSHLSSVCFLHAPRCDAAQSLGSWHPGDHIQVWKMKCHHTVQMIGAEGTLGCSIELLCMHKDSRTLLAPATHVDGGACPFPWRPARGSAAPQAEQQHAPQSAPAQPPG